MRMRARWLGWMALLALVVLSSSLVRAEANSPAPRVVDKRVLIIATGNVPAGKFVHLQAMATERGIALEHRYLHKLPADADASLWQGFDAVFFDSYLQDEIRERLSKALPALRVPSVWLYDAGPSWKGFPDALGQRLVDYYASGAETNFAHFFDSLRLTFDGGNPMSVIAPVIFPKTAVYHPQAPNRVFASVAEYLAWRKIDANAAQRAPIIAVAFHQQSLSSMETGLIDSVIDGIEQRGGTALAFYSPVMGSTGIAALLAPKGNALHDVMLTAQITLDGEARRKEFVALQRPVLQMLNYRNGSPEEWAADPVGLSLTDVPFFLSQPEFAGAIDAQVVAGTQKPEDKLVAIPAQAAAAARRALGGQGKGALPLDHRRRPRTTTWRITCGRASSSRPTRWSTSARTARRNGCPARSAACRCTTTRCWPSATCRWCTPTSSTTSARPCRPSAAAAPSSSATRRRRSDPPACTKALTRIHDLLHAWLAQDEGAVKRALAVRPAGRCSASASTRHGLERARASQPTFRPSSTPCTTTCTSWPQTAQPLGLHTFGTRAAGKHRLATVLLMLGRPFWEGRRPPRWRARKTDARRSPGRRLRTSWPQSRPTKLLQRM
jgi:hypothetical protein